MSYYPIFLDVKGKRCLVIGGGSVALRKTNMLIDHEAKVVVISPQLCTELEELGEKIITVRREYQTGDLDGAFVVVAATDNQAINEQIATDASEKGILINVVDVPDLSNFIVPSYLRRGDLTIAVSTNGKSPALSRKIRTKLEDAFEQEYADLIAVVEEVRVELKSKGITVPAETWQQALDLDSLLGLIGSGKSDQAKLKLIQALKEARV
ncbi:MAG: bifunctional precorrin-2 dehydrogenase/sirohydrochlorin ferrochelatase [Chloroflexi bacterium]|nr:bifunctional precorrin-2 dehydrogenase/sirohydrochlorin ferrochelatase [Chloroflexota bacterium]